jgi:hypothetical protein
MWELIQDCWQAEPTKRPTVGQLLERMLAGRPHLFNDERPLCVWDNSFPSKLRLSLEEHPFCSSLSDITTILSSCKSKESMSGFSTQEFEYYTDSPSSPEPLSTEIKSSNLYGNGIYSGEDGSSAIQDHFGFPGIPANSPLTLPPFLGFEDPGLTGFGPSQHHSETPQDIHSQSVSSSSTDSFDKISMDTDF